MENKRIYLFDNVKLLLIASVVVGHMIGFYEDGLSHSAYRWLYALIYSFHMPAFIFVSGLFHKNKNIPEKAFGFIAVAVLMKVVQGLYKYFLYGTMNFNLFTGTSVSWYMQAMAVFLVVTYFLRNVDSRLVLIIALVLGSFSGFADIGNTMALTRVVVFFPFYYLGSALDRNRLVQLSEKKWLKAISAAVIAGWAVFSYLNKRFAYRLMPLLKGKSPFTSLHESLAPYGIYLRVMCYAVSFALTFAIIFLLPNVKIPLLTVAGQRTLQIYFWHPLVLTILINFLGIADMIVKNAAGMVIFLLLAIPITGVLALKPFAFPTEWVMRYRLKQPKPDKSE